MNTREITEERKAGPTPAGGAYSVVLYLDKNHNPVDKSKAEIVMIHEYDKDDNMIQETIGII